MRELATDSERACAHERWGQTTREVLLPYGRGDGAVFYRNFQVNLNVATTNRCLPNVVVTSSELFTLVIHGDLATCS